MFFERYNYLLLMLCSLPPLGGTGACYQSILFQIFFIYSNYSIRYKKLRCFHIYAV